MHFTVMVIGDNDKEQLESYSANSIVKEYELDVLSENDKNIFIKYYNENYPETIKLSFSELYEKHGEDWNENIWRENEEGVWYKYSTYNPNSKWDWYILGGRWSGMIKLKENCTGIKGECGSFNNTPGIDAALKGDIANIDTLITFAVLKDGEWYEQEDIESNINLNINSWYQKIKQLLEDVSDDTLISIYDCHI